jgi:adenosylcobinamide kinase/adenosylcobinamide-phosphate guanylyltransferase
MGKISFVLGGARSGKSAYAQELAEGKDPIAFIATCSPQDTEMKKRVKLHKQSRPAGWDTFEEPKNIVPLLEKKCGRYRVIVIDCLTILISNLMADKRNELFITNEINSILRVLKRVKAKSIIVSNEVGLGLVPMNKVAREFRDIAGRVNQITAKESDRVFFMVSGISRRIK